VRIFVIIEVVKKDEFVKRSYSESYVECNVRIHSSTAFLEEKGGERDNKRIFGTFNQMFD
jgi:hypothetical protein